jgi:hypothetical protein
LTLCRLAVLAALYVLLTMMLSLRAGNLRVTFASLPVVVCGAAPRPGGGRSGRGRLIGEFHQSAASPLTA